jgi:hypothetical protein
MEKNEHCKSTGRLLAWNLFGGAAYARKRGNMRGVRVSDKRDEKDEAKDMVMNSALYREFLAEREEILRHKWLESEKAGYDIGFENALLDWIVKHRAGWRKQRKQTRS